MPFVVIKGEVVPGAGRPDGDSIRFRPDRPDLLTKLKQRGSPAKVNERNGTVQLRFEGIDTMESRSLAQFSAAATASNLELCGVPGGSGAARAYILSNQLGPRGRPIAFVFSGDPAEADGDEVFLDAVRMRASVNFQQMERGHAYPLFYDTLYSDLRSALTTANEAAKTQGAGVYSADVTMSGAPYAGAASVEQMPPIFPKLWRRLDSYSKDRDIMDQSSLGEFESYLKFDKRERVLVLSRGESTGFHNLVAIQGDAISMSEDPTNLVFSS